MKSTLRTALLSSAAVTALLAFAPNAAQAQMYTTSPGTYLSLEGRYTWNAGSKAKNYAYDYASMNAEFPPYDTSQTAADHGFGGKLMVGYRFTNNWDVGFGLFLGQLKGKDNALTYNYVAPPAPLQLALAPNALTDHLNVRLQYGTVDFEAGYNMPLGGASNFRLFGGLRFAYLDQKASGTVNHAKYTGDRYFDYSSQRKTTFAGVGPRLGANGVLGIGNSGFNVFGGLSGALLIGRYKDHHSFVTATNGVPGGPFPYTDQKKTKIIPNVEGEIGLGYTFNAGGAGTTVGLQAGYRGEAFLGAATKGHVSGPYKPEKSTGDYLLHGPFARLIVTFGAPVIVATASPPPAPPVAAGNGFIVFFDFDRSNITAPAQATINDAIAAAKAGGSTRVTLTGHTDRSGSEQYNQALSVRRGEAVKAAMIRGGIPANAIVVIGRGESVPLVNTPDGVREPQNRRVEIVI